MTLLGSTDRLTSVFFVSRPNYKQAEIIEASDLTPRYLDDRFNINNPYCEGTVKRIY